MRFARTKSGFFLDATKKASDVHDAVCHLCLAPVRYYRGANPHYRHCKASPDCKLSVLSDAKEIQETGKKRERERENCGPWHRAWQALGAEQNASRREARGVGGDPRPRDLGDVTNGWVIEFQHSQISKADYDARVQSTNKIVWIFDATDLPIWSYERKDTIYMCTDRFKETYITSNKTCVLFHCSDNRLYKTICDEDVRLRDQGHVRLLDRLESCPVWVHELLCHFFGPDWRPPWTTSGSLAEIERHVQVLSAAGRSMIDEMHRSFLSIVPTGRMTIVHAPPGAGKTTTLVRAIEAWDGLRVLVISFNVSAAEVMEERLLAAGLSHRVDSRTLDSLIASLGHGGGNFVPQITDKDVQMRCFKKTAYAQKLKYGLRHSGDIIAHRLLHPEDAIDVCQYHQQLTAYKQKGEWTASVDRFPITEYTRGTGSSFAARRYVSDRDGTLGRILDEYDIVVVDEMQDLMSAQEIRLITQTKKPIVMVGDPMQAINDFRHDFPCDDCRITPTETVNLPDAIEWYGTYRLDPITCAYVEEYFDRKMFSYRYDAQEADIAWSHDVRYPGTLVLCRCNSSVIEYAMEHEEIFVINGDDISRRLKHATNDGSARSPLARYARSLGADFTTTCEHLEKKSISLASLHGQDAVGTVHQVKGFEYEHVAVHFDILEHVEDIKVAYVAFTRHTASLTFIESGYSEAWRVQEARLAEEAAEEARRVEEAAEAAPKDIEATVANTRAHAAYSLDVHRELYVSGKVDTDQFLLLREPWRMYEWEKAPQSSRRKICNTGLEMWRLYRSSLQ